MFVHEILEESVNFTVMQLLFRNKKQSLYAIYHGLGRSGNGNGESKPRHGCLIQQLRNIYASVELSCIPDSVDGTLGEALRQTNGFPG